MTTDDNAPRIVVMSGLAASGKSTLGQAIATRLELDLIDKDDELDALFDRREIPSAPATPDERRRLSRLADDGFIHRAQRSNGAVIVSFWRRDEISPEAGTPTAWLHQFGDVTEVFCRCAPEIAAQRFVDRRRHPGHGDSQAVAPEALARLRELAALGPLGLGRVVEVDTDEPLTDIEIDQLADAIRSGRPDPPPGAP